MKKFLIILAIIVALGGAVWFFFLRGDDNTEQTDQTQKQDFPVQYDQAAAPTEMAGYENPFGNLSFQHPNNWNIVEGDSNTESKQLFTIESPQDTNEFYFCLDFNFLANGEDGDFTITESEVVAVSEGQSGRNSVIYKVDDVGGLYWGVTSEMPEVGANTFINEISNPDGARLQIFGRFNCRETERPDLTADEFQNSQWFHEAKSIVDSIEM